MSLEEGLFGEKKNTTIERIISEKAVGANQGVIRLAIEVAYTQSEDNISATEMSAFANLTPVGDALWMEYIVYRTDLKFASKTRFADYVRYVLKTPKLSIVK